MKRLGSAMMVGVVALLVTASAASAQYVFLGGGLSLPTSDFKDVAKKGWLATGGVGVDVGDKGLWVEAEAYFGGNTHKGTSGDKTKILAGLAALGYSFMPDKSVSPYITGGLGFLSHRFRSGTSSTLNDTETKFAYSGALGLGFKAGNKAHIWLEGRYMGSKGAKLFAALAGFSIQFGN